VTTTTYGFGYSLQNSSGTDAKFEWDDNTPVTGYKAKQFPNNTESSTQYIDSNAEVMYNAGPVSGSSVYVCYRLNISAVQEPGLYFNKVRYTATATF